VSGRVIVIRRKAISSARVIRIIDSPIRRRNDFTTTPAAREKTTSPSRYSFFRGWKKVFRRRGIVNKLSK